MSRPTRRSGKYAGTSATADDRGIKSMRLGRYPFAAGIPMYARSKVGCWNPNSTMVEESRKLRQIGRQFETLKKDGKVPSADPRLIRWVDVQEWMLTIRHLDPDVQGAQIMRLNGYLRFFRNYSIQHQLDAGFRLPRRARRTIRVIDEDDLPVIFEAAMRIKGWTGSVARGMMALYFATGVRPSELRLAEFNDLDMTRLRFFVRHPKGEGNWASPEWVNIIRGDVIPLIDNYLRERSAFLASVDRSDEVPLFPKQKGTGFYSANRFRQIKQMVVKESGINFRLKDFRSTLCSMTVQEDRSRLPDMAAQLRHSIATAERYYAAIDRSRAGRRLKDAWKDNQIVIRQTTAIDDDNEVTGYE